MMKHSRLDFILVLLLFLQLVFLVLPFVLPLSIPVLFVFLILNIILMGTNYQCIAHNFIHLPFFKHENLNKAFSVLNSLGLGLPQSLYRLHHLNHHRYNNNPDGDMSSIYRYGINGKEENIFSYSLLGVMRTDLVGLYKKARKGSRLPLCETGVLVFFLGTLLILNWKLFIFYILPSYFGGQVFAVWENFCEHHLADFRDRKRDSVSCYNSIYNFVWFNNGYHQEHHFSPQVHWTRIRSVRSELPQDRVIAKGCHLFHSFK